MLEPLKALPQQVGLAPETAIILVADTGFCSQANVEACGQAGVIPLIAQKRESHSGGLSRQLAPPPVPPENPTAVDRMRYRLATPAGRAAYALRTNSRRLSAMRFRQFLVRGLKNVKGEWGLVCLAFNINQKQAPPGGGWRS